MATTFKVLGNGTPVLSMRKWSKWHKENRKRCNEIQKETYIPRHFIDEDDLSLDWKDFKRKYPDLTKEEFELKQKEFQEM